MLSNKYILTIYSGVKMSKWPSDWVTCANVFPVKAKSVSQLIKAEYGNFPLFFHRLE